MNLLNQISAVLFESDSDAECVQAVNNLHAVLSAIVELSDDPASSDLVETQLSVGKALSPRDAARCTLDYMRTRSFLRGVRRAVIDAQVKFPGEMIHILYAGCGPFAPLFLPLTTQFGHDQIQFTLLDIHERSLACLRQIVDELGVSTYVRDFVQCDASTYQISDKSIPHIIVIETMQRALEREPQVAITRNLLRNLRDGGILIPESIELRACLGDMSKEVVAEDCLDSTFGKKRKRIELGLAFELTATSARQPWTKCNDATSNSAFCSPPVKIKVPATTNGAVELMILTEITVYDSSVVRDYESALTIPTVLADLSRLNGNSQLEFWYVIDETPGLRWKVDLERGDASPLFECLNGSF